MENSKDTEHFNFAIVVVLISVGVSLFAFMTEDNGLTGFAVSESSDSVEQSSLMQYSDINSLRSLAEGNYYIDSDGIVYWMDDSSKPAIAQVNSLEKSQKNRLVYIDREGRIGYILP